MFFPKHIPRPARRFATFPSLPGFHHEWSSFAWHTFCKASSMFSWIVLLQGLFKHDDEDFFTCNSTLEKKLVLWCVCSAPIHSQRETTRLVSYYAFMIGWLLPSQPPSCQRDVSSFTTHTQLRDLSIQAGLFPFRRLTLAPNVCLHNRSSWYSEFSWTQ